MVDVPLNEEERRRIIKKGIEVVLQPSKIRPEPDAFLHRIITDAKMRFYDGGQYQFLQLKLYGELDRFLTGEILANLPAKHRDTFMQMHSEHRPYVEVDKFIEEHMPNAKEIFADAPSNKSDRPQHGAFVM